MNILFVITKLELGGAQKQLLGLIRGLNQDKCNIFLFTASSGLLIADARAIKGLKFKESSFLERSINPFKDFIALIEIFLFIRKNKIDIVHTHSSKAGILGRLAAKLAQVKTIIHTVHGWSFNDYQPRALRQIYINLERFCAKFTKKIIVVSNYDMEKGLANRIGVENKYVLIRYAIDKQEFILVDKNIRGELGLNADTLVVGMVACFKPQKAPLDFIKVASLVVKELPNVKFILVGDGILRPDIEKLIQKLNLKSKIILTGWRRDISRLLSLVDVFVLTSLWEGLPVTVLEAIASGKPPVVTDTGGVSEVVADGKTGFLVKPHQVNMLAKRVVTLLRDQTLREIIGNEAKKKLQEDFSLLRMVSLTRQIYVSS